MLLSKSIAKVATYHHRYLYFDHHVEVLHAAQLLLMQNDPLSVVIVKEMKFRHNILLLKDGAINLIDNNEI